MGMKSVHVYLNIALFGISNLFAQQHNPVYKGIVKDNVTMLPLNHVRIYYCDTIPAFTNQKGVFQLNGHTTAVCLFRKEGYVWHTEELIIGKETVVYLSKSNLSTQDKFSKEYSEDKTEIIFDDMPVPYEEWGDALSIDPSEIKSIGWELGDRANVKNKLIIKSAFKCAEKDQNDEKSSF
jgi:hypothetical protein